MIGRLAAVVGVAMSLVGLSVTQSPSVAEADVLTSGSTLVINGLDAITIKSAAGGLGPSERVAVVAKSLERFRRGQTVRVVADPGLRIALQDTTIVTITVAEAKAHGKTPDALADEWSRAINKALYVPPLTVLIENVELILGKSRTVRVIGSQSRMAQITVEPEGAVKVERRGFDLLVTPLAMGEGQIMLSLGDTTQSIPFTVMAISANLPQTLQAEVTGNPASKELVVETIRGAMSTMLESQPGARIDFDVPPVDPLVPGQSRVYQVRTVVSAPGFAESRGLVNVAIKNVGGGRVFEDVLWYSNEPENLKGTGQLYFARLNTDTPGRLLWHHCNKTANPLVVQYVLANRSAVDAKVWLVGGDPEPHLDPTKAGFEAGKMFFPDWTNYQGSVVTVPARSVVPIVMRRITAEQTTSGLATLRLLPGGADDVVLVANALYPNEVSGEWQRQVSGSKPWLERRAIGVDRFSLPIVGKEKHVYAQPAKQVGFLYQVGGKLGFVRIGQESIASAIGGPPLSGNFGVQYVIEGRIENPGDVTATVEVVFEASAGYSGALFSVNGKVLPGRMLQTKESMSLFEASLRPGEARDIRIETIPLSGAHYPATITIRQKGRM